MGKHEKLDKVREVITNAVPFAMAVCSGMVATTVLKGSLETPAKPYLKAVTKVGLFAIGYTVETIVTNVFKKDLDEIFDEIGHSLDVKEMRDALTGGEVTFTFETEGVAKTVASKAEEKAKEDGHVSVTYILDLFDDEQVTSAIDKEHVSDIGWKDGFSWTVEPHVLGEQQLWVLTLPPCERLKD